MLKHMGIRAAEKHLSRVLVVNNKSRQIDNTQTILHWQKQALKKIQEMRGIKTKLKLRKKGGDLNIRFYSNEDLKMILQSLLDRHI